MVQNRSANGRGVFIHMKNVRRGARGIFEFRKAVPPALRELVGKWEWKQSLDTSDEAVAIVKARKLERAIAAEVAGHKAKLLPQGALEALTEARRIVAEFGSYPSDLHDVVQDRILSKEGYDRLEEFVGDAANPRHEVISSALALAQGDEVRPTLRLSDAVKLYVKDRAFDRKADLERNRQVDDLIAYLKEDRDVEKVSRFEARAYMERLTKQGYAPGSVNKQLRALQAMFTLAYRELESERANPWSSLKAKDDEAEGDKRNPFTLAQAVLVLRKLDTCNDQLRRIGIVTAFTGARLNEVAGLDATELREGTIYIQPNAHRKLKTKTSKRAVPLVGPALEAMKGLPKQGPLFPTYAGKSDIASAALMKMLRDRAKLADGKLTWHSWRHLIKDLMRNAKVAPDTQDRLLGHSGQGISFNYGSGPDLPHMREELNRALMPLIDSQL